MNNPDSQEGINMCLSCELEKCELDTGRRYKKRNLEKAMQVRQLKDAGLNGIEIAMLLNISRRAAYRYLHELG